MEETADGNPASHLGPAISLNQFLDNGFQCDPVQRIAGMGGTHERMANGIGAWLQIKIMTYGETYCTNEDPMVYSSCLERESRDVREEREVMKVAMSCA